VEANKSNTVSAVSQDVTARAGLPYGQAGSTLWDDLVATDTRTRPKAVSRPAPRRPPAGPAVTLTGRGGLVVVFASTLLGSAAGAVLDLREAQGVLFVAGCLLAVLATRRTDLLPLVVSPPLVFLLVSLLAAALASFGERSFLVSVALTVMTALTANVPWLFLGTVGVVVIAVPRGLPACLRELGERVAADGPFRRKGGEDDDPVRWDEASAS
jgi:hypothetical protein